MRQREPKRQREKKRLKLFKKRRVLQYPKVTKKENN